MCCIMLYEETSQLYNKIHNCNVLFSFSLDKTRRGGCGNCHRWIQNNTLNFFENEEESEKKKNYLLISVLAP